MINKWRQRVLSATLAISMTFGLWPAAVTAPALADEAISPVATDAAEHTHDDVTFTEAWSTTDNLPSTPDNYYLTADVTITQTWEPADGTSLCLNGHTITANIEDAEDGGSAIRVNEGVTFSLYDCGEGTLQAASEKAISAGVLSEGGGIFNMHGGTIQGFYTGVTTSLTAADEEQGTTAKYGTFNMNGGTITGCTKHGVYVFSGTFNMKDGLVTQNTSDTDGAGVYVQYSTFNMTGGEISNNVTKRNGGGLYVFRTTDITISGGSITGNSALATDLAPDEEGGNGGGVYVSAHSAVPGELLLTGGTIANNMASNLGGGVYMDPDSVLKVSGAPNVSGNTATDKSSNVQLGNKPITVTNKLEDGASIGITRASDSADAEEATEAENSTESTTETSTDTTAFTSGYKETQNTVDPATYFMSDDEAYLVGWTDDGKEARLVTAYNVIVEETQNGTVTASATKARAGDSVTLTVTPTDGYQLKALAVLDANKKEVEVANNVFTMPESDVTVSAAFEATYHTITFDANGGSGTMEDQSVTAGESATLNENKFTRSGYTFKEWNTQKDGSGVSYKDKATIEPEDSVTLYAQWTQNSSSSTSSTTSSGTLSKTADPTSVLGALAMLVAGAGATCAGMRRKRR